MITQRAFHINKETIQLLRFPFSLYLAPVFLFALSQVPHINWIPTLLIFVVLHLLVYPSSNGFNSYMDRDTSSIGGLEKPPLPTVDLYYITVAMDIVATFIGLIIHFEAGLLVGLYILASRAYSDRRIRLKKYPWGGFFVVTLFQGGITFLIAYLAVTQLSIAEAINQGVLLFMVASSLIIGASYPLTQIYQHQEDKENGDVTLSMKLGYTGTFIFSALFFMGAMILLYFHFNSIGETWKFFLFAMFTLPVLIFFGWWFLKVKTDAQQANFKNTMRMNTISAATMALYFLILTIINQIR